MILAHPESGSGRSCTSCTHVHVNIVWHWLSHVLRTRGRGGVQGEGLGFSNLSSFCSGWAFILARGPLGEFG